MGRPLKGKYFGKRNSGDPLSTADDYGIGGSGIVSIGINAPGSYTSRPTLVIGPPDIPAATAGVGDSYRSLPGGVQAVGTVTSEVLSATISGTQTKAYSASDVLTVTTANGTSTYSVTKANSFSAAVTSISTTGAAVVASGTYVTGMDFVVTGGTGDNGTYYVLTGGVSVTAITLTDTYQHAIAGVSATFAGGTGGTATVGATYNTITGVTPVSRGTYTVLDSGAQTPTNSGGGAGALITMTYRAKAVAMTESGSGYLSAPSVTSGGSVTYNNIVLTAVGSNTAVAGGTFGSTSPVFSISANVNGGGAKSGDIIKQESSRRFRVKTADGVAVCHLTTNASVASGEVQFTATDSHSNTYYIRKISSRNCTVWPSNQTGGGTYEFVGAQGYRVAWNITGAVNNTSVKISTI
jgi:hypothetical protein